MMRILALLLALLPSIVMAQAKPEQEYPLDLAKNGLAYPKTTDPELQRIFNSPRTVPYKLRIAWQHFIPAATIEHKNLLTGDINKTQTKLVWGLYSAGFRSDLNANLLFPWNTTFGLNEQTKTDKVLTLTYDLLNLKEPDDHVVVLDRQWPIMWIYPGGTTVCEALYVNYEGKKWHQEIRTRQKDLDCLAWDVPIYRPIKDRAEFQYQAQLGDYTPAKKFFSLRNPQEDTVAEFRGLVERLPPLDPEKVKELLSQPFKNVTDANWAPAADQDFHLFPRDYCFGLVGSVDKKACAECHRQTQISVGKLVPREPLIIENQDQVGSIRGCDGVFTWHPFADQSIRNSDKEPQPKLKLRRWDVEHGIVKVWDGVTDMGPKYKITKYVQDSLQPHELPPKQFLHAKESGDVVQQSTNSGN